jgi:hypothetical protein
MKLPAERAVALFEVSHVEVQLARQAQERKEVQVSTSVTSFNSQNSEAGET